MRSENYVIQLQLENQKLQKEKAILNTALFNACQTIAKEWNYSLEEIIELKNKYISRVKDSYKSAANKKFKVKDILTPIEDCMNNFRKGYKYEITKEIDDDFLIDDIALINKEEVYKYFKKAM